MREDVRNVVVALGRDTIESEVLEAVTGIRTMTEASGTGEETMIDILAMKTGLYIHLLFSYRMIISHQCSVVVTSFGCFVFFVICFTFIGYAFHV